MYSIMICEDERIDRVALRALIGEGFPDLALLEDCADGTEALRRVPLEKPDILILDINMPGCDGIEVVRRLRQQGYEGMIMIHTAYDRFAYARDALNYGANAFLLKPVKHAQFIDTLRGFIAELNGRRVRVPGDLLDRMTEQLLPTLFSKGQVGDEALRRYLGQRVASAAFIAFAISEETRLNLRQQGRDPTVRARELRQCLADSLSDGFQMLESVEEGRPWVLFYGSAEPMEADRLEARALCQLVRSFLSALDGMGIFLQSAMVCSVSGLPEKSALQEAFTDGLRSTGAEAMLRRAVAVRARMIDRQEALRLLEAGSASRDVWAAWQTDIPEGAEPERFAAACALLLSLAEAGGGELIGYPAFARAFPPSLSRDAVDAWVTVVLDALFDRYYSRERDRAELYVRRACAFVKANYDHDISLAEAAEYAGVSASHLSHLFRQRLDTAFVDYVQDVRMQRLRELLAERDYSVRELAARLGYNNHTYFCQIVRKRTGKTVNQMKREIRGRQTR